MFISKYRITFLAYSDSCEPSIWTVDEEQRKAMLQKSSGSDKTVCNLLNKVLVICLAPLQLDHDKLES